MTVHQRRGRYLEELHPGDVFEHRPGRTITEADNLLLSVLSMNTQSLHLDAEFAAHQEFGQRLVNSMFTLATVVGLSVADLTDGTTVGNLGFEKVTFPAPVFIGDTVYASTEVVSVRPSRSRPGQGIVMFEHSGRNQRGVLVCAARRAALVLRAPAETGVDQSEQ
ncbi:MaoC family dehydratase [Streptomyces fuscichromogenes]|uniref:MaoC-like dehydratase n=1 Tax=Streptomyces fuscichromogenes TaxID=1324013 RepID=A0A918CPQ0_9ACTN|nr:MaoC family dehydratase [Streptomyces fuscichromogenes]GGM98043.1 MaoC-like dehydratase [Streptomyces fuscichromogenes]